jgi:hypothetical protein
VVAVCAVVVPHARLCLRWQRVRAARNHVPRPDPRLLSPAAGDEDAARELQALCGIEDRNLLAGRVVAALGSDVGRAQELLLASSQPLAAIELRKQLGDWEEAYQLAQQLDPTQAGLICMAKAKVRSSDLARLS